MRKNVFNIVNKFTHHQIKSVTENSVSDSAPSPLSLTVSQARFYGGAKHPQIKSKSPSVKAVIMAF